LVWTCVHSNGGRAFTMNVWRHISHIKAAASFLSTKARTS
jgi:hypothetical protein